VNLGGQALCLQVKMTIAEYSLTHGLWEVENFGHSGRYFQQLFILRASFVQILGWLEVKIEAHTEGGTVGTTSTLQFTESTSQP
jgi:hypothetical protein